VVCLLSVCCLFHVGVSSVSCWSLVRLSFPCCLPVIHLSSPCCLSVIHLLSVCITWPTFELNTNEKDIMNRPLVHCCQYYKLSSLHYGLAFGKIKGICWFFVVENLHLWTNGFKRNLALLTWMLLLPPPVNSSFFWWNLYYKHVETKNVVGGSRMIGFPFFFICLWTVYVRNWTWVAKLAHQRSN
jgi:hypothetical protein